jgi:AraC-like DNA-binding protein
LPWEPDTDRFIAAAREQVPFDAMVLALFHGKSPQPDEVLARSGVPVHVIQQWCSSGLEAIGFFRAARKSGVAIAAEAEETADLGIAVQGGAMLHALPESLAEPRWWFFLLANNERPFTLLEQRIAGLLLRQWQAGSNQMQNPPAGCVLIGHDDRLIHADPWTQLLLLEHPEALGHLTQTLRTVARQRWDVPAENKVYDFAIEIAERPYWVRFHRAVTIGVPPSEHWFLALHPLEEGELPVIGGVEDPRIARALGYIHEHFHEAPSLADIAAFVHVSPFHFHRLFTRGVGISPKHYLQAKQLQFAKWMLRGSREPVSAIASKSGFASHGHFSSTFQKLVGMSPSQFRDKNS